MEIKDNNKSNSHPSLKFEFFDVTADVGYRAYGKTLNQAFENAALAMFEVMTDTNHIKPELLRKITLKSEDEEALLYDWLSELLFFHDSEYLVFSRFNVEISDKMEDGEKVFLLEAVAEGQEFDPDVHERRDEVKAATYHMMDIQKKNGYMLQVILDI
ncbi:archease [Methanobacterium aggregans]|uniref:archease n=1 Tax=Methanobacterium aggregans TaxID=1615586 RepID=UPI001AE3241C|nr:SHS2 domain-containing protein [Methanobacterium aggregans]